MIAIKNPKEIYVRGDYNLVYDKGVLVAIIVMASVNEAVYWKIYTKKNYRVQSDNPTPNIIVGEQDNKEVGFTLCEQSQSTGSQDSSYRAVNKSDIEIDQYYSLSHPLEIKWEIEECKQIVYLSPNGENFWDSPKVLLNNDLSLFYPNLITRYDGDWRELEWIRFRGNILVHDPDAKTYLWYDKWGRPEEYTTKLEWDRLSKHYGVYSGDCYSIPIKRGKVKYIEEE